MSTSALEVDIPWDSHVKEEKFKESLDKIKVSTENPIVMIRPHRKESFDIGFVIFDHIFGKPLYVCLELKSSGEIVDRNKKEKVSRKIYNTNAKMNDFPKGGKQYNHTAGVMGDRRFVYYHLNTKIDDSFMIGNVANFGRENIENLVGTSIIDLYYCGRKINVVKKMR